MTRILCIWLALCLLTLPLAACNVTTAKEKISGIGESILNALPDELYQKDTALDPLMVTAAFKEALDIGTQETVAQLSAKGGFNLNRQIRISLPGQLAQVQSALSRVGLSYMMDDLELRMNRAAEAATPYARELFIEAITQMTFDDVLAIYHGQNDAATRYFQSKMSPRLTADMSPHIQKAIAQAGLMNAYNNVMGQYKTIPFVPDITLSLSDYVVEKTLIGIFDTLAQKEADIRTNPVKQTTQLLRDIFGRG